MTGLLLYFGFLLFAAIFAVPAYCSSHSMNEWRRKLTYVKPEEVSSPFQPRFRPDGLCRNSPRGAGRQLF
jgi:hypothetical protein